MNIWVRRAASLLLILLGILLQVYGIVLILQQTLNVGIGTFLLGFIVYFWGQNLTDIRSLVLKLLIHAGLFFISLSMVLFIMNTASSELTDSIQPSIDFLVAHSIDDIVEQYSSNFENEQINLLLAEEIEIETYANRNLTQEQASTIAKAFNLEDKTEEDQLFFAKFIIGAIYTELQKNSEYQNVAVPLDTIESEYATIAEQIGGIDTEILSLLCQPDSQDLEIVLNNLKLIDPVTFSLVSTELIASLCSENSNAYINVLLLENKISKTINTAFLSEDDANLIWENLGFEKNISSKSKQIILQFGLGFLAQQTQELGLASTEIPVASVTSLIPEDIIYLFSYDLFAENITQRQEVISSIRGDCRSEVISFEEVCEVVLLTDYNYLLGNIDMLEEQGAELPVEIKPIIEEIDSLEKIENKLQEGTDLWKLFAFLGFLFLVISIGIKYLIEKREDNQNASIDSVHFFAKENITGFIPYVALTGLLFFLFGKLLDLLPSMLGEVLPMETISVLENLSSMPVILALEEILYHIFYVHFIYFVTIIILFAFTFFITHRIQSKKTAEKPKLED